jgi:hypothetical protein
MLRVAEKFRVPLHELDRWDVSWILDEADIHRWLHDLDDPPK